MKNKIIKDLEQNPGKWTSAEIANRIGYSTASVASTLCYMRGDRLVSDGAVYTKHSNGVAWGRPKGTIKWFLIK